MPRRRSTPIAFAALAALAGVVGLSGAVALAPAQDDGPAADAAIVPDIKRTPIARMIGTWKGGAWMIRDGRRGQRIETLETAEWRLNGDALLVEGLGTTTHPETGEEIVGHSALALIRFDPRTRTWRFHAFKGLEPALDAELEILDNGDLRWSFQPRPQVFVRYTLTLTEDTWTELGAFSTDAERWTPMLEMELTRVADDAPDSAASHDSREANDAPDTTGGE